MKYLKVFNTESQYQEFKKGRDYVTPNISLINENNTVSLTPIQILTGDVAYWDGSKVNITPYRKWNESLGTPVGVVVIPSGFTPDGKVRIISLNSVDASGNTTTSHADIVWSVKGTDTNLTNYTKVPTIDNAGSTSTGSNNYGYLPSDMFTGTTSYVDSKANYFSASTNYMVPSPYLGNEPNPEYYKTLSNGYNALSDFNGLSNTETLVGLGSGYTAANAAWKYNDGSSNLQWYLPGMGELGFIMPRFNEINATITALGGLAVASSSRFWSSSEYGINYAYHVDTTNGYVNGSLKNYSDKIYMRPFASF